MTVAAAPSRLDLFKVRDIPIYLVMRFLFMIGAQMQNVAVGWLVYRDTRTPVSLGLVGLFQFLPAVPLAFLGGALADRFERRRMVFTVLTAQAGLSLTLFFLAGFPRPPLAAVYAVLFLLGVGRSLSNPASQALVANLPPKALLPQLLATSSVVMNGAILVGPSLGGLLLGAFAHSRFPMLAAGAGSRGVFLLVAALIGVSAFCAAQLRTESRATTDSAKKIDLQTFFGGLRYVFQNRALLGSISLDLFAVLLGGVVALLPIFAEILNAGSAALGFLRSAMGAGAVAMGLVLGVFPIRRHAGLWMFASVFAFGLLTIAFAFSRSVVLSVAILFALGAVDMVSVVIRSTLAQLETPDEMRGRVSAVNMIFISASNELGEFESGMTAAAFGTVPAAVLGGVGTCVVVLLWFALFPSLRRFDRMEPKAA